MDDDEAVKRREHRRMDDRQRPDPAFVIVGNPASGAGEAPQAIETAATVLRAAGREVEVMLAPQPSALAQTAREAVAVARRRGANLVAVGGDGSVASVVGALLAGGDDERTPAFGVLPMGTFNFFARTHRLPQAPEEAAALWLHAAPRPVQVGRVNDQTFLVHAALGLYPRLLEDREAFKQRYGRSRLVALWAGVKSMWRGGGSIALTIEREGRREQIRVTTLFIGNNRLQLEQIGVPEAPLVEQGRLVALWLTPTTAWQRLLVALRGAFGDLAGSDQIVNEPVDDLTVVPRRRFQRRQLKVALDGEVSRMALPLRIGVAPQRVMLLAPPPP
jgi:diacylglycerol kinase family enzyme